MSSSRSARVLWTVVLALVVVVADATAAAADPAGPTDYRSEVVALVPAIGGIDVSIVGGDSFVVLTAAPGTTVEVVGYRGEPYLRFEDDGIVLRNERAPTRWLNEDRYAEHALPPGADPLAEPDWQVVARDGSYAWHDHRTHWMNTQHPPGAEPGDVVLEAVLPLVVNGGDVAVHIRSVLLADPSPVPAVIGASAALTLVATLAAHRRLPGVALAVAVVAAVALVVGLVAYRSVPPETGPSMLGWALPAVALAVGVASMRWRHRPDAPTVVPVLVVFAAGELCWWWWTRRAGLGRAFVPTDAPQWLDRAVTAASVAAGLGAVVAAAMVVAADSRRRVGNRPTPRNVTGP